MSLGTLADPKTLAEILSANYVQPGHRIWLRGGTYSGDYTCALTGTSEQPITLASYPGERATIDGSMTINGAYTTWKDIECMWSGWPTRQSAVSDESDMYTTARVVNIYGAGVKVINCVIHDIHLFGWWTSAVDSLFYGNIIYNIGFRELGGQGNGHTCYCQNETGVKTFKHNIGGNPFNWNFHAYGGSAHIDNFHVIENALFNSRGPTTGAAPADGILIGADVNPAYDCVVTGNMTYGNRHGYLSFGQGVRDFVITNNIMPDGISLGGSDTVTTNSGNVTSTDTDRVFVLANEYQTGRANVIVYNWSGAETVTADVSAVLANGAAYRLRNGADYYVDVVTGTVSAEGTIAIDMRAASHSVAVPVAWETAGPTTFPDYGVFVLEAM